MADPGKRKLQWATIVYWVLLVYIIAALLWWALSLLHQNEEIYQLKKNHLASILPANTQAYKQQLHEIEDERKRNISKYIGEGATFLLLIIIGAAYIYRSVRRQFKLQRQQQNFVMAVTHELKTPISVSRLNLETLLKYNLDEEKKSKLLHMTLQETLRLDTLINNILISSQLDGNSYKVSREDLNLSDLTTDVVHQFANRYPDRKLQTGIQEEIEFTGDPLLLKLLVSNLLENANKYSPKEKPIEINLAQHNGDVNLEVNDEGEGIPEEEKKNVFEKFYRIGSEQTRKTQGTGLGLYLCKKIVADHNGIIHLKDNHPQGSKFIVQFPA
jgi:two-component system, OmpR family, sensor histidine kinase CiaH